MLSYTADMANRAKANYPDQAEFIDYLHGRIIERAARGQSSDCDEYRELWRLSRAPAMA